MVKILVVTQTNGLCASCVMYEKDDKSDINELLFIKSFQIRIFMDKQNTNVLRCGK
jgi:hypothetical protein